MEVAEFNALLTQYRVVRNKDYCGNESGSLNKMKQDESRNVGSAFLDSLQVFLENNYGVEKATQIKSVFEAKYRNLVLRFKTNKPEFLKEMEASASSINISDMD